jgi:protein-L-isoaspartate(D-aspartate) O-methyltransferase
MVKKGPLKPTQQGLKLATKSTEAKAPTLTPMWGNPRTDVGQALVPKNIWPRPPAPPGNTGLSSERTRQRMVERLMQQGIRNEKVLAAMRRVPRHRFVDEALASRAYEDSALPIGHSQTISQPFVVARVIELALQHLAPQDSHPTRALEVGTGCGYQAAVMAACFDQVVSVERIKVLSDLARSNLRPLRVSNLRLVFGDGLTAGLPFAPFDAILLSAGMANAPEELLSQLGIGGVLVAPIGEPDQRLMVIQRVAEAEFSRHAFDTVRYVPILRGTD